MRIKHILINPEGILCASPDRLYGQNLLQLKDDQFICGDPPNTLVFTVVGVVTGTVAVTLLAFILPFSVVHKLRVKMYAKFHIHPFDSDECTGEGKKYDAFISYAEEDEHLAVQLANELETSKKKYKVTYFKAFLYGVPEGVLFCQAIERSKRNICLVSRSYLDSDWCLLQFEDVYSVYVDQGTTNRLIAIKIDDVDSDSWPTENLNIKSYLRAHEHIIYGDSDYMDNLLYCMPIQSVTEQEKLAKTDKPNDQPASDQHGSSDQYEEQEGDRGGEELETDDLLLGDGRGSVNPCSNQTLASVVNMSPKDGRHGLDADDDDECDDGDRDADEVVYEDTKALL